MTIGAVVLAAGFARRMGRSKLDLLLDGKPLLAHVLEDLTQAGLPLLVVTGAHSHAVAGIAAGHRLVPAADYTEGLGASLRAGVGAAPPDWAGLLVVLGDMPFVAVETYRALATALQQGADAVVPVHGGMRGNPAGFSRANFASLLSLNGDQGARALLARLSPVQVPVDDPGIHRDIDTASDLRHT